MSLTPSHLLKSSLISSGLMSYGVASRMILKQSLVMGHVEYITRKEKMYVVMGSKQCQLLNQVTVAPWSDPKKKIRMAAVSSPMLWMMSAEISSKSTEGVQDCCFHTYGLVLMGGFGVVAQAVVVIVGVAVGGVLVFVLVWFGVVVQVRMGMRVIMLVFVGFFMGMVMMIMGMLVFRIVVTILMTRNVGNLIIQRFISLIDCTFIKPSIQFLLHNLELWLFCNGIGYDRRRMTMGTLLPEPMRMPSATMEHKIHANINEQPSPRHNQHNGRLLHKLLIDNPAGRLDNEEEGHRPDNEQIGDGSDDLEAVKAKRFFVVWMFRRVVQEHEAQDETDQVGDQVGGVADHRDRVRQDPAHYLPGDEDQAHHAYDEQFCVALAVVLLGGNGVQSVVLVHGGFRTKLVMQGVVLHFPDSGQFIVIKIWKGFCVLQPLMTRKIRNKRYNF